MTALLVAIVALTVVNALFALRVMSLLRYRGERLTPGAPGASLPALSIVVPARNEERQIESCIRALLDQDHPDFEVIAVDDCSDDATPTILERLAADDARLRVVRGAALPRGWVGKPWALAQGARIARGDWLLFTDADAVHAPPSARSAQRRALDGGLDALSLLTEHDLVGSAERIVMPSIFLTIFLGTGPIEDVGNPAKPNVALFNGQYILMSRAAYDAIGGHGAVRTCVAEDLELARALKRHGGLRIALLGSRGIARVRMYRSFREIWQGFVKNFALGVEGKPGWALAALALLGALALSPPVALAGLVAGAGAPALGLLAALVAASGAAELAAARIGLPRGSGVWLYPGIAVTLAILVRSMWCYASGRGVEWRGRRYGGGFSGN